MQQVQIDDLGFCPSFNCYSSDNQPSASAAAAAAAGKISRQFHDLDEEDFEFSLVIGDEELSAGIGDLDSGSDGRTVFPLFNRDLLIQNDDEEEIAVTTSLEKLFINERDGSGSSSSSSEAGESDGEAPAVFCVWRHGGASPLSKCKKSSSTGSGSKRWRIRDLLRRSNSEGKDPMVLYKKVDIPKRKLNSVKAATSAGKLKPSSPSIHEFFYVQQRAKREDVKRKSYLPYRQGLVGFFSNVNNNNGKGKKSLF